MRLTDPQEQMQWIRNNWYRLKKEGRLVEAINRYRANDKRLSENWTVERIIEVEESLGFIK